jgi:drug/metabolite transporter superfamily protein YnfA
MSHIEKIMTRLRSVEWKIEAQRANPAALEGAGIYLRTFADFLREWHVDASAAMPFASPCQILGVSKILPSAIEAEAEGLTERSSNSYDEIYVKHALEWAALCDASHPATHDHEDMFRPLLDLVVDRVPTGIRKGYWVVDENLFPLLNWIDRYTNSSAA